MYQFNISRIASEVQAALPRLVTEAKRTSMPEEHPLIELAGQATHVALQGIDPDSLIDMQVHGSDTANIGARTFFISITARAIREKNIPANIPEWTPDQGPMTIKSA
jgi:hypothetical protein